MWFLEPNITIMEKNMKTRIFFEVYGLGLGVSILDGVS